VEDPGPSIITDMSLAEEQERELNAMPAKEAFAIWSLDKCLKDAKSAWTSVRNDINLKDNDDLDTLSVGEGYWDANNPPLNLPVAMDPAFLKEWVEDYKNDQAFRSIWANKEYLAENWKGNRHFLRDKKGLLFFLDDSYQPRLCMPKKRCYFLLREAHENPLESAHMSAEHLWQILSQKFYWK